MTEPSRNGHTPHPDESAAIANPYADAVTGRRPPELVEFELHTDPYANIIPRVSSVTSLEAEGEEYIRRRPHPIMLAVSLVLIAVLVLPIMAEVFIRLIH